MHTPTMPTIAHSVSSIVEGIMEMGTGRGVQVAPGWRRRHPAAPRAYATAICHRAEHLQTQGALVAHCYCEPLAVSIGRPLGQRIHH